ncbi:hypothetical protein C7M84_020809 [Penaeus vannamei]|uniref:Uncharacterized protein n=1 Tax=Penaeus vannamei TaxID=6689 RepID=A0A3R7MGS8_PENVA|nr:hypothetical protein C7M84_020809 [Penaeus vannamei]
MHSGESLIRPPFSDRHETRIKNITIAVDTEPVGINSPLRSAPPPPSALFSTPFHHHPPPLRLFHPFPLFSPPHFIPPCPFYHPPPPLPPPSIIPPLSPPPSAFSTSLQIPSFTPFAPFHPLFLSSNLPIPVPPLPILTAPPFLQPSPPPIPFASSISRPNPSSAPFGPSHTLLQPLPFHPLQPPFPPLQPFPTSSPSTLSNLLSFHPLPTPSLSPQSPSPSPILLPLQPSPTPSPSPHPPPFPPLFSPPPSPFPPNPPPFPPPTLSNLLPFPYPNPPTLPSPDRRSPRRHVRSNPTQYTIPRPISGAHCGRANVCDSCGSASESPHYRSSHPQNRGRRQGDLVSAPCRARVSGYESGRGALSSISEKVERCPFGSRWRFRAHGPALRASRPWLDLLPAVGLPRGLRCAVRK